MPYRYRNTGKKLRLSVRRLSKKRSAIVRRTTFHLSKPLQEPSSSLSTPESPSAICREEDIKLLLSSTPTSICPTITATTTTITTTTTTITTTTTTTTINNDMSIINNTYNERKYENVYHDDDFFDYDDSSNINSHNFRASKYINNDNFHTGNNFDEVYEDYDDYEEDKDTVEDENDEVYKENKNTDEDENDEDYEKDKSTDEDENDNDIDSDDNYNYNILQTESHDDYNTLKSNRKKLKYSQKDEAYTRKDDKMEVSQSFMCHEKEESECINKEEIYTPNIEKGKQRKQDVSVAAPKRNEKPSELEFEDIDVEEIDLVDPGNRSIIRTHHFIKEILRICSSEEHHPFECGSNYMKFIGEVNYGLKKKFSFHCENCNAKFLIDSEPDDEYLDLNYSAVAGIKCAGIDHIELEEVCSFSGIHCMSERTYQKISQEVDDMYVEIANHEIAIAGAEERQRAEKLKSKSDEYLTCPIIVDGSWTQRSYGSQGRSKTGSAVGIGDRTGKILFYNYRNKYCRKCSLAAKRKKLVNKHRCFQNYSKDLSSSSMESDIIAEGFRNSIRDHQLVYNLMIADGDSSVYSRVLHDNPYDGIYIKKIECTNHLLRNLVKKLKQVMSVKTGPTGTQYKKLIFKKIMKMRMAVVKAAEYRRNEEKTTLEEKITFLQADIQNIPSHVFGNHENCAKYFCNGPKKDEVNIVPELTAIGLFDFMINKLDKLSYSAESILHGKSSNRVECFNSVVNKKIGGKRKCISQKGLYRGKLAMAVVQFNTQRPASRLNEFLHKVTPQTAINMEDRRIQKNESNVKKLQEKKETKEYDISPSDDDGNDNDEKTKLSESGKEYYGQNCKRPDITPAEFKNRVRIHYKRLYEQLQAEAVLEICTREKNYNNSIVLVAQRNLLINNVFGEICRMRPTTQTRSIIKRILYPPRRQPEIEAYEKAAKKNAKKEIEKFLNSPIKECGLFTYLKAPYLCVIPDGMIRTREENDTVLVIECPFAAKDIPPNEAIRLKIAKINTMFNKEMNGLNRNSWVYYRMIGAMEITEKPFSLFVLWTGKGWIYCHESRNEQFWQTKMERILITFYEKKLLLEIIDPRETRSMEARESIDFDIISWAQYVGEIMSGQNQIDNYNSDDENKNSRRKDQNEQEFIDDYQLKVKPIVIDNEESNDHRKNKVNNTQDDPIEIDSGEDDENSEIKTDTTLKEIITRITTNQRLMDNEIDMFGEIVASTSLEFYVPQSPLLCQIQSQIKKICPLRKHIQILYNGEEHWTCAYFNTKQIFMYDSLNGKRLRTAEYQYLKHLLPEYDFINNPVKFMTVERQPNVVDCGVFAIAFAVSIMYGLLPEKLEYDHAKMRDHLLYMLQNNEIGHFPLKDSFKHIKIPIIQEVINNEIAKNMMLHKENPKGIKCLCKNNNYNTETEMDIEYYGNG